MGGSFSASEILSELRDDLRNYGGTDEEISDPHDVIASISEEEGVDLQFIRHLHFVSQQDVFNIMS